MSESSGRLELPDVLWQRVSPKYITVELVSSLITGLIMCAVGLVLFLTVLGGTVWGTLLLAAAVVIALLLVILAPRRARAIGYRMREDDLLFRRGIMFQRFVSVPYGRMQLVDISRGPLARMLGLADLRFVTAAAATGVSLPGLASDDADALRDELVTLAESRRSGL